MYRILALVALIGILIAFPGQVLAESYPPPLVRLPAGAWRSIPTAIADYQRTIKGYEPYANYVVSDIYLAVGQTTNVERSGGITPSGTIDKVVVRGTFAFHNKNRKVSIPAHDFLYYVDNLPFTAHTPIIPPLSEVVVNYEAPLPNTSYIGRVLAVKLPGPEGAQRATNKIPLTPNVWVNDTVSYRDTRGNLAQTVHGVGEPFSGTDTVECTREGTFTVTYELRVDTGQRAVARVIVHCSA